MNTSQIGDISEAQVLAALVRQGTVVLLPFGNCQRYDFVIEEDGIFKRVQVKTGTLRNGVIRVNLQSTTRGKGGYVMRGYHGQVDLFGVYCPDTGKVYIVPANQAINYEMSLRVKSTKNRQKKGIVWAKSFEVP